jgi:hypothetical protein
VLVIEGARNTLFPVALVAEEPSPCGVDHHAIREGIRHLDGDNRREGVGRVLFPSENRNPHFADQRMTRFVREHEQHVAGHELDAILDLLRGPPVVARVVLEHVYDVENPLLERCSRIRTTRRIRLGNRRLPGKQQQERQRQGRAIDLPCNVDPAITDGRTEHDHPHRDFVPHEACHADALTHRPRKASRSCGGPGRPSDGFLTASTAVVE